MTDAALWALCQQVAHTLAARQQLLVTAESCTAGLIAATCTDMPGSSAWFERGFISYSNAAKTEMLGVDAELITTHGAVSEPVARAMALGALSHSHGHVAVSVTGIAGPNGGSADKPVGTVWFGWAHAEGVHTATQCFPGDRTHVRTAAVRYALEGVLRLTL